MLQQSLALLCVCSVANARYVVWISSGGPGSDPHNATVDNTTIATFHTTESPGQLQKMGEIDAGGAPMWLSFDTLRRRLWSTLNDKNGAGMVQGYNYDGNGSLSLFGEPVSVKGDDCVFIQTQDYSEYMLAANYNSGTLSVLPIDQETGMVLPPTQVIQHHGHGTLSPRQDSPHPHMIARHHTTNIIYSPDLGLDKIFQYHFIDGELRPIADGSVDTPPGFGPRHFVSVGPYVYVCSELNSMLSTFSVGGSGELTFRGNLSTLPEGYTGESAAGEIVTDPTGSFLFVSNRGYNAIAAFAIEDDGTPRLLDFYPSGGWNRGMALDPEGRVLYALNQNENSVTTFTVDGGVLTRTQHTTYIPNPVSIVFHRLD